MTHKTTSELQAEAEQLQEDIRDSSSEHQDASGESAATIVLPEGSPTILSDPGHSKAHSPVPARAIKSPAFEAKASLASHTAILLSINANAVSSIALHQQAQEAHALASTLWAAVGNNRQAGVHTNAQTTHAAVIKRLTPRVKK